MPLNQNAKAFIVVAVVCAMFESLFLLNKFPRFESNPATPQPLKLASFGPLHVGAVLGQHGASFARLSRDQQASSSPTDERTNELVELLRTQLNLIPLKAALEFVGYTLLAFAAVVGVRTLWNRNQRALFRAISFATLAGIVVLCLEAPLAVRYDSSMWSTWVGPGAFSYSYSQQRVTMIPGVTVAHRTVLEAINLVPVVALRPLHQLLTYVDIWIEPARTLPRLIAQTTLFFSGVSFMVALGLSSIPKRGQPRTGHAPAN